MTRLHGFAYRLFTISDLSTGLNEMLGAVLEVFDCVCGTIQILDAEAGTLFPWAPR